MIEYNPQDTTYHKLMAEAKAEYDRWEADRRATKISTLLQAVFPKTGDR